MKHKGEVYEFEFDQLLIASSAATATVLGRSSDGWTEWNDKQGRTMDELLRQS
jgi:hypothetical protein